MVNDLCIPSWFFEPAEKEFIEIVLGTMADNERDKARMGDLDPQPYEARQISDDWTDFEELQIRPQSLSMVLNYVECLMDDGAYLDLMEGFSTEHCSADFPYRKIHYILSGAVARYEAAKKGGTT